MGVRPVCSLVTRTKTVLFAALWQFHYFLSILSDNTQKQLFMYLQYAFPVNYSVIIQKKLMLYYLQLIINIINLALAYISYKT